MVGTVRRAGLKLERESEAKPDQVEYLGEPARACEDDPPFEV